MQEKESIMLSTFPVEMEWMMKAMILFLNRYVNIFIEAQIDTYLLYLHNKCYIITLYVSVLKLPIQSH